MNLKSPLLIAVIFLLGIATVSAQKTPGVYVKEISTFPASVASVPTSIPAFLGVTELKPEDGSVFHRVHSLAEYENLFGKSPKNSGDSRSYLHDSIRLFYANGGGEAYVYSVGSDAGALTRKSFLDGLEALKKEKGPSLILFPDAVGLGPDGLAEVQRKALNICGELQDRFCILDVPSPTSLEDVSGFRDSLGEDHLQYGAVYGPWLKVENSGELSDLIEVPASGAIAGVYAAVDSQSGVWNAPATRPEIFRGALTPQLSLSPWEPNPAPGRL